MSWRILNVDGYTHTHTRTYAHTPTPTPTHVHVHTHNNNKNHTKISGLNVIGSAKTLHVRMQILTYFYYF